MVGSSVQSKWLLKRVKKAPRVSKDEEDMSKRMSPHPESARVVRLLGLSLDRVGTCLSSPSAKDRGSCGSATAAGAGAAVSPSHATPPTH